MNVFFRQAINMIIVILLLGIPFLLTWLLLKYLGFKRDREDGLNDRIKELEERLRLLEEDRFDIE